MHAYRITPIKNYSCRIGLVLCVLSLGACSTSGQSGVTGAIVAPLNDLNLVRVKIPEVLLDIQDNPYALPEDKRCTALTRHIQVLDNVLGPDLDTLAQATKPGVVQRGSKAVGAAAVGVLRNTTEGVLPLRGWVRKLTGAERHSRLVAAAIAAGMVRRGFLKGLHTAKHCPPDSIP